VACLLHLSFTISLTLFTDLSISTYFPTPQANPSSLPPINWSTKPKKTQHNKGTLDGSQGLDPTAPADSAMDGSGKQLALLSRHLGLRRSVGVVDVSSQQDGSNFYGVEFSTSVNNPISIVYEYQDRICPQNEPSELDLTAALSRLSTSDAPVLLEPRAPPGCPSNFSTSPFLNAYKYYVVIKGKCTGVYYGKWYVFRHQCSGSLLMTPSFIQE
jgi:hypothetical protein